MQPDEGHHPDYNFIMNPAAAPKKRLLGGGDKKQRLLISIIVGGLLFLVIGMAVSLLLGSSGGNNDRLFKIMQQQTELIRVSEVGLEDATTPDAKNFASTVKFSLTSAKNETSRAITAGGGKVNAKLLGGLKDANTDAALAAAKQANNFDEVLTSSLQAGLTNYQQELSEFFNDSGSKTEKALLKKLYSQAEILTETSE